MAESRRGDQAGLTDAAAAAHRDEQRRHNTMNPPNDATEDCLSLEDILRLYSQPINEEQAWAVCYQCCRTLAKEQRGRRSSSAATTGASSAALPRKISGPGDVWIQKDGSVKLEHQDCEGKTLFKKECVLNSAGIEAICRNGAEMMLWSSGAVKDRFHEGLLGLILKIFI